MARNDGWEDVPATTDGWETAPTAGGWEDVPSDPAAPVKGVYEDVTFGSRVGQEDYNRLVEKQAQAGNQLLSDLSAQMKAGKSFEEMDAYARSRGGGLGNPDVWKANIQLRDAGKAYTDPTLQRLATPAPMPTPEIPEGGRGAGDRFVDSLNSMAQSDFWGLFSRTAYDWLDAGKDQLRQAYPNQSEDFYEYIQEEFVNQAQRQLRDEYAAKQAADPAWRPDESFFQNALAINRWGPTVLGSLVGASDPTMLANPGGTIARRALGQAAIQGGANAAYQAADVYQGVADEYDPLQTATAAALGGAAEAGLGLIGQKYREFRRPEDNIAPKDVAKVIPSTAQAADQIRATIEGWQNAPKFTISKNFDHLPDVDKDAIGVFDTDTGKVRINMSQIDSPETLSAVVYHEALGHHGLQQKFGDELDKVLDDLYYWSDGSFRQSVDDWMTANPGAYADDPNPLGRAAEEVLAEMSQDGKIDRAILDRLKDFVKNFARDLGFDLKYSDREVRSILGMAHDAVVKGNGRDVIGNGFRYKRFDVEQEGVPTSGPFKEIKQSADGTKFLEYTAKNGETIPIKMAIDDGTAEMAIDQFSTRANRLGPREIREAMAELQKMYPEIERFGGYRRSGAGRGRVQEIEAPRRTNSRYMKSSNVDDLHDRRIKTIESLLAKKTKDLDAISRAVEYLDEAYAQGRDVADLQDRLLKLERQIYDGRSSSNDDTPESASDRLRRQLIEAEDRYVEVAFHDDRRSARTNSKAYKEWLKESDELENLKDRLAEQYEKISSNPNNRYMRKDVLRKELSDSKVVDKDGELVKLYHGTSKDTPFKEFKVGKRGAWFTEDPENASGYASNNDSRRFVPHFTRENPWGYIEKNSSDRVIPVYLDIKNPKVYAGDEFRDAVYTKGGENYSRGEAALFEDLRKEGYDGVKIGSDEGKNIWVVLDKPTQIKSALSDTGRYMRKNAVGSGSKGQLRGTIAEEAEGVPYSAVGKYRSDRNLDDIFAENATPTQRESWEEWIDEAGKIKVNAKMAENLAKGTEVPMLKAVEEYLVKTNNTIYDLSRRIADGEVLPERDLYRLSTLMDRSKNIDSAIREVVTNAARILNSRNIAVESDAVLQAERIRKMLARVPPELLATPEGAASVAKGLVRDAKKAKSLEGALRLLGNTLGLSRTLRSSLDLSAPLRQGLPFISKGAWWRNIGPMLKYAWNGKEFERSLRDLRRRPTYKLMEDAGLYLADPNGRIGDKEEAFVSSISQKIPGVAASERAYVGFLNQLRADVFDDLLKKSALAGQDLSKPHNHEALRGLAEYVNTMTGRGSLSKGFDAAAPWLAAGLFSPRFIASRLNILANPLYYARLPAVARKDAIRSLLALGGIATVVLGLAEQAGYTVETDLRSSDSLKIRDGNIRYDILGGFGTYLTLGARLATNERKTLKGDVQELGKGFKADTRWDLFTRALLDNKLSPNAAFLANYLRGENVVGRKFDWGTDVPELVTPMFLSDLKEVVDEEGDIGVVKAAPGILGVGVSAYGTGKPKEGETVSDRMPTTPTDDGWEEVK